MPRKAKVSAPDATREKLLVAASEVFAEVGFRDATVRQIVERAGANIAAVNYHFGDKEALYAEVLRSSYQRALEKYPPDFGLPKGATPQQRLEAFVRAFLFRVFDQGPHSHHGKLMAREMVDPTAALDVIVRTGIGTQARTLMLILQDILGKRANPTIVRACGMSIVSQVIFYHTCRPVIARMFPDLKLDAGEVERLATHITRFSLAGLQAYQGNERTR